MVSSGQDPKFRPLRAHIPPAKPSSLPDAKPFDTSFVRSEASNLGPYQNKPGSLKRKLDRMRKYTHKDITAGEEHFLSIVAWRLCDHPSFYFFGG